MPKSNLAVVSSDADLGRWGDDDGVKAVSSHDSFLTLKPRVLTGRRPHLLRMASTKFAEHPHLVNLYVF